MEEHLLEGLRSFYKDVSTSVYVQGEVNSFGAGEGVREGCVMSPWLLNIYTHGCMK